jgi:hypothetical protein
VTETLCKDRASQCVLLLGPSGPRRRGPEVEVVFSTTAVVCLSTWLEDAKDLSFICILSELITLSLLSKVDNLSIRILSADVVQCASGAASPGLAAS